LRHSSLIGHTVEAYGLVTGSQHPADSTIDTFFRSHKYLGSHDRRFIAETVYGMLRYKKRIEWLCDEAQHRYDGPADETARFLHCIAYRTAFADEEMNGLVGELDAEQGEKKPLLLFLAETKERNKNIDDKDPFLPDVTKDFSLRFSFPEWMIEEWRVRFGDEETRQMCTALNVSAPLTLRVNTLKTSVEECRVRLAKERIDSERTKFSPFGLTLRKRINVFQLDIFRRGFFEVQDEGSQLLSMLVDPKPTSKVVDACAGGGGKSLALAALMKNRGMIFALDTNAFRLEGLRKRIRRSGVDTIRVRKIETGELPAELAGSADNVLVDAPCSGLGTIRRNPGMKWTVTPASIAELSGKQSEILDHYARFVKVNGRLAYSTCTMMHSENEAVVEKFLAEHPDFEMMEPASILRRYGLESLSTEKYFRLKPHVHGTDGFFAAVMRRTH
jgi:16S rRNA (cytosine967-C5)-methyltransferase